MGRGKKHSSLLVNLLCALALVVVCALVASARQGGGEVGGSVRDQRGGALAGATVTLYSRERGQVRVSATTGDDGSFRFARLAPGEYLLEAEAEGFARTASRAVSVGRGETVKVELALEVAALRAEVVVTASDAAQAADEVSKAVSVVGRREIEERDEASVAEALRTVPGLRVQQLGGPGAFVSVKARGLRNQDTSVLIDGLRFRDPAAPQGDASGFLSDLLIVGASRVEVLRGSGSSLYGTNAVGGVINVVTEEGGGPLRGGLFAEGGSLGYARGRVQLAGGAGEADRFVYSAALSHMNVARGVDGDDAARNTSGQGRALFRLTPTTVFSARLYGADSFLQLNEEPQAVGALPASGIVEARAVSREELRRYEAGAPLSRLDTSAATFLPASNDADFSRAARFFSGAFTLSGAPVENFGYTVSYHALATRNAFREGPATPGDPFDNFFEPRGSTRSHFDGALHTVNARADLRIGSHNFITAGYEYEYEDYASRAFDVDPSGDSAVDATERSHTLFVQDQLRFMDSRLQLSAAFRAQRFSLDAPRFTPQAGAPYADVSFVSPPTAYTGDGSVAYLFRSTGTKLRAHVGNGYRKPSLFERFGTFFSSFTGGFGPLGDPRLAPERSIAFDAGVDQTLARGRARLSTTYFYTRLQQVVGFGDAGANDPFGRLFGGFINTGGGIARGFETSASLAPSRTFDLFASYTYTNSDQRRPLVENVLRSFGVPDHQFTLVATKRMGERTVVNFDLAASSDYLAPIFDNRSFRSRAYRFDGLRKGDLTVSYTIPLAESKRLRLFGKLENLFDHEYYENGFRAPGLAGRAGAALSF